MIKESRNVNETLKENQAQITHIAENMEHVFNS